MINIYDILIELFLTFIIIRRHKSYNFYKMTDNQENKQEGDKDNNVDGKKGFIFT